MSRENNILRGITNQDLKTVIAKALREGWVLGEMSGTTHATIVWPKTGAKVGFGTTVSDRNAYKTVARRLEVASGITLIPRNKTGKISNKAQTTGFSTTRRSEKQDEWSSRIEELLAEHKELTIEFKVIASHGETPRSEINRAFQIVKRVSEIESFLQELRHPLPEFNPHNPTH